MKLDLYRKIIPLNEAGCIADQHREHGRSIVLCHGCFDIVHPGHLRYLQFAREQGHVLVVSITGDDAIEKGDGSRPYVPQELRAESLAAIGFVDHVVIVDGPTAEPIITALQPDIYIKGKEYENSTHPGFLHEKDLVESLGGRVLFSSGDVVFSSTNILDSLAAAWKSEGADDRMRLQSCCRRWGLSRVALQKTLRQFADMKVAIVGDSIADRYVFCEDQSNVAGEAPILSVRPQREEAYLGGAAILAAHVRHLGGEAHLFTRFADDDPSNELRNSLDAMGVTHHSVGKQAALPRKVRYLVDKQKLLKVDHGQPLPIDSAAQRQLLNLLNDSANQFDAVIFPDFGYGMLSEPLLREAVRAIRDKVSFIAGDVSGPRRTLLAMEQFDLLTPTERELRSILGEMDQSLPAVAGRLMQQLRLPNLAVTMDRRGCVMFRPREDDPAEWFKSRLRAEYLPALSDRYDDLVGAGDAMLTVMTMAMTAGGSLPQAGYLGSLAAALAISRVGNLPIRQESLLSLVHMRSELNEPLAAQAG